MPNIYLQTWVILSGITHPTFGGWEVNFEFTAGTGTVTEVTIPASWVDYDPHMTRFSVGMGTPIPTPPDGNLILAEMTFLYTGGVVEWFGGPPDWPVSPGRPSYSTGGEFFEVVPCHFSTDMDGQYLDDNGWTTIPLAVVNGYAPVETENSSWGNLKTMFR